MTVAPESLTPAPVRLQLARRWERALIALAIAVLATLRALGAPLHHRALS
jgi:hypothetical protein